MSYNSLLNMTCDIQTKTVTYSNTGAATKSWADAYTDIKCTIQPISGDYASKMYGERLDISHIGFFKIGQSISSGDKVVVGTTEYIVKQVFDAASRVHHKEVGLALT